MKKSVTNVANSYSEGIQEVLSLLSCCTDAFKTMESCRTASSEAPRVTLACCRLQAKHSGTMVVVQKKKKKKAENAETS